MLTQRGENKMGAGVDMCGSHRPRMRHTWRHMSLKLGEKQRYGEIYPRWCSGQPHRSMSSVRC